MVIRQRRARWSRRRGNGEDCGRLSSSGERGAGTQRIPFDVIVNEDLAAIHSSHGDLLVVRRHGQTREARDREITGLAEASGRRRVANRLPGWDGSFAGRKDERTARVKAGAAATICL